MSTTVAPSPTPAVQRVLAPSRIEGPRPSSAVPFSRLVRVELRKMTDTLAGRWLMLATGGIIALVIGVMLFTQAKETTFAGYLSATSTPMLILIPIIGILAVTSEWSQRTGLVSLALEPRRGRWAWAKVTAAIIVSLLTAALAIGLAALATLAGGAFFDGAGSVSAPAVVVWGTVLLAVLFMAQGLAFAMLFRNSPAAIVTYFALPMAYGILSSFEWFTTIGEWTDLNRTLQPLLMNEMDAEKWAQFATSVGLWVVLPFVIGMLVLRRAEVK